MSIEPLLLRFSHYLPMEQEALALEARVKTRKVKRGQFLLAEGEVSRHYHFVVQRCFNWSPHPCYQLKIRPSTLP